MKIRYREALIEFCPDLTDPSAPSMPVAILLVAEGRDLLVATAAGVSPSLLKLDAISREVISDLPHLIKRHIKGVKESLGTDADVDRIIFGFHNTLRNSLHVSEITDPAILAVDDEKQLYQKLIPMVMERIQSALMHWIETYREVALGILDVELKPLVPTNVRTEVNYWPMQRSDRGAIAGTP